MFTFLLPWRGGRLAAACGSPTPLLPQPLLWSGSQNSASPRGGEGRGDARLMHGQLARPARPCLLPAPAHPTALGLQSITSLFHAPASDGMGWDGAAPGRC